MSRGLAWVGRSGLGGWGPHVEAFGGCGAAELEVEGHEDPAHGFKGRQDERRRQVKRIKALELVKGAELLRQREGLPANLQQADPRDAPPVAIMLDAQEQP